MFITTGTIEIIDLIIMVIISQGQGILMTIEIGIIIEIEIITKTIETIIAIKTIVKKTAKDHILTIEKKVKVGAMVEGRDKYLIR